jgi:hypothetical protein
LGNFACIHCRAIFNRVSDRSRNFVCGAPHAIENERPEISPFTKVKVMFINEVLVFFGGIITVALAMYAVVKPSVSNPFVN